MAIVPLALVPVALTLPLVAAFTLAVVRFLAADDRAVVMCTTLSHSDELPGRRNPGGCGLLPRRRVISSLREPAKAVLRTHFERGELGFERSEPCLEPCLKRLTRAEGTGADDDTRATAGHGWRSIEVLLIISASVGRRSIPRFWVATSALGRPIEHFTIISPGSFASAAVAGDAVPIGVEGVGVACGPGVVKEALQRLLGVRVVTEIIAVDEGGGAEAFLALTRDAVGIAIETERIGGVSREGCLGITLVAEVLAGGTLFLSRGIVPKHEGAGRSQPDRDCKRNQ
jgi:hypothetical protein